FLISFFGVCRQDFKHEVNLLIKLRHPNIVQFLGAVTETKPLMLVTEFLRGVRILL
ncbi:Os07g0632800, partial [Oryza sativa Japonica Group]